MNHTSASSAQVFKAKIENERVNPAMQDEDPGDLQVSEPRRGWVE